MLVFDDDIVGRYVILRSATVDDAEFTLAVRQDKKMTRYLPYLDITLDRQIAWIKRQRETEGDYFFVVWDKNGKRIGTIGIYNIENGRAESGRQTIYGGTPFQAIEANFLNSKFGYEILGLKEIYGHIFPENKTSLRMTRYFGSVVQEKLVPFDGKLACKVEGTREIFNSIKPKILDLLSHEEWA